VSHDQHNIPVSTRDLELLLDGLAAAIDAELVDDENEATAVHERLSYEVVASATKR
jgi:hypothetical protein